MDNSPEGPFKHYERPTKPRTSGERPSSSRKWGIVITVLIIILVVLIPVVHHFASAHNGEKVQEVQRVSKTQSSKKNKAKSVTKKNKTKSKSTTVSKPKKQTKTYVVKSGDTLTSIAQKFNMSVSELVKLNKLSNSDQVNAGQTLKVK